MALLLVDVLKSTTMVPVVPLGPEHGIRCSTMVVTKSGLDNVVSCDVLIKQIAVHSCAFQDIADILVGRDHSKNSILVGTEYGICNFTVIGNVAIFCFLNTRLSSPAV